MSKVKKIKVVDRAFENNRMWESGSSVIGDVEGKLDLLRYKLNEIIEELNKRKK